LLRWYGLLVCFPLLWTSIVLAVQPAVLAEQFGVPLLQLEVVESLPHATDAFTQGLVLAPDGYLYESTGLAGFSTLRRLSPDNGEILLRRELPSDYFGEGLAWLEGCFYQLTWQNGIVLRWDAQLEPLPELCNYSAGWGLTVYEGLLVQSDGSHRLFFRDPNDFSLIYQVEVKLGNLPLPGLNELELVEGQILANIYGEDFILRISPEDGQVTGIIDAGPLVELIPTRGKEQILNGIAWDAQRKLLWLTGKNWPHLFLVRLRAE